MKSDTWAAADCAVNGKETSINCSQGHCKEAAKSGKNINIDYLRPYKGFGTIRTTNNDANSMYNGLQLSVNRRFVSGFSYGVAYTYAKSRTMVPRSGTSFRTLSMQHNLWGPSYFDNRHTLVLNYIYELPLFRGQVPT